MPPGKHVSVHAQENFLRTIERVAFFFLAPGFTDHWPSDYEFKVRTIGFMVTVHGSSSPLRHRALQQLSGQGPASLALRAGQNERVSKILPKQAPKEMPCAVSST